MLKANFTPYQLPFKTPVLTSRGEMKVKNGYFLSVTDGKNTGVGECSFIEGLSIDRLSDYESVLGRVCYQLQVDEVVDKSLTAAFPSIRFGVETALLDLKKGGKKILFESDFAKGKKQIPINGLVWMGTKEFMVEQMEQKLAAGFKCIKIKVGAIAFDDEVRLLRLLREKYSANVIEIRLDANGAFTHQDVFQKLEILSGFAIHSIEQPVKKGQLELMMRVCKESPIPVALDEELIGISGNVQEELLSFIQPQYLILKPSLLGGIAACEAWIMKAETLNVKWWATSALESNIGLNAIAQWVVTTKNKMVQGLGTGELYLNNISSPLYITNGHLAFDAQKGWDKKFKL